MKVCYDGPADAPASPTFSGPGRLAPRGALRCLRMIADGVLDRPAQLQIAVGHPSKELSFYGWQVGADSPAL